MQTSHLCRVLATILLAALASCSRTSGNPYATIANPPLVQARLHTLTLATDGAELAEALQVQGYAPLQFSSNYPASDAVEASLLGVPQAAVENVAHFKAPAATDAGVRVLRMAPGARAAPADTAVEKAFFRNVLGSDVPKVPAGIDLAANARVQAWTFVIPDVLAASKRLREGGIAVSFDPVAITTSYLGDHKTMAIRAPDGVIVELVETASQ